MHPLFDGEFMSEQIINNHGPLTKMYYSYGDGQKQEGDDEHIHGDPTKMQNGQWGSFNKYDFISEGDSPAFLHLVNVGLDNLTNPHYGGWGGRLVQSATTPSRWEDGEAAADFNPFTDSMDIAYAQTRWIEALQNDFATRANWCVKKYSEANHAPVVTVLTSKFAVRAGEDVTINAVATDPDKNKVQVSFWHYQEAGTGIGKVIISNMGNTATVTIPSNAKSGSTFHIIVQGKDDGLPALTRYKRVIITVK
jgi:hypothetical protein